MSIHRLLMRLFPAFCGGKALNGNVKHFVFYLTCDVTGDLEVKFLNFIWKTSSRPFHCRLNFSPTSVGFRDRWGAATPPPPPPQQRVGSGLGPAGRGLINVGGRWKKPIPMYLIPLFCSCGLSVQQSLSLGTMCRKPFFHHSIAQPLVTCKV